MAKIIVLDPGHGGPDPGAIGNDLREKDVTLAIAQRAAGLLRSLGADVRLTRNDAWYYARRRTRKLPPD